ncbi:MAG: hypothetical protein CMB57_06885 [Euryarchaeota archaeon]|nr:hypothetical protein [Euryarchaeota archaeon]
MSRRRSRSGAKKQRRESALEAQTHLSSIISDVSMPMIARTNAAKHLVRTSSRNRLPLPVSHRHWICRGCTSLLIPGTTAKVRIREGQRITTCLECGTIKRFGGGPKYNRGWKN